MRVYCRKIAGFIPAKMISKILTDEQLKISSNHSFLSDSFTDWLLEMKFGAASMTQEQNAKT